MSEHLSVFIAAAYYEFRMQIHRAAVWITMFLIALVVIGLVSRIPDIGHLLNDIRFHSTVTAVTIWTQIINILFPIGMGILLADRLPRDQQTKVNELLMTAPTSMGARLIGKYIGSLIATLVPVFLAYCFGVGVIYAYTQDIHVLLVALETFAAIVLPGALFVAAFSLACPAIVWIPIYQMLFAGYWFWGNLFPAGKGIPTLSQTLLTPMGSNVAAGFFHTSIVGIQHATALQGIESMLMLISTAIFVLCALIFYLHWKQARQ